MLFSINVVSHDSPSKFDCYATSQQLFFLNYIIQITIILKQLVLMPDKTQKDKVKFRC